MHAFLVDEHGCGFDLILGEDTGDSRGQFRYQTAHVALFNRRIVFFDATKHTVCKKPGRACCAPGNQSFREIFCH